MANKTTLSWVDGSIIKQGDTSSVFKFKLRTDDKKRLNGPAKVQLIHSSKGMTEFEAEVVDNLVSFRLEKALPVGSYDGYRFANGSLRLLKVGEVPVGFRSSVSLFLPIAHDGKVLDGTLYLAGTGDSNWLGIHNYKDIMQSAGAVMRLPMLTYISDEAWPDVLPGTKM